MVDISDLDAVEETALLQVLWRAEATRRDPSRLNDVLACEIADTYADPARIARLLSGPAAGAYAELHVACTRAVDARLRDWIDAIAGPKQIVILGCGFDGRSRRCDFGSDAAFFLVDRSRVLSLLQRHLPEEAPRPSLVTANVGDAVALFAALAAARLRTDIPTAFILEGVAEFLGLQRTQGLIRACRNNSGGDSLLLLQLLDPQLIAFAVQAGDRTFPWRKLPAVRDILQDEVERAEIRAIHAEPPWNASFDPPLAHVVAITL
jgi:O-methyltransferase involved in polyketide biosynthesis